MGISADQLELGAGVEADGRNLRVSLVIGNGLTGTGGLTALALLLDTDSGLEFNGVALRAKVGAGLSRDGTGVKIDTAATFAWSGAHDFSLGSIVVPNPTINGHAATKGYVDTVGSTPGPAGADGVDGVDGSDGKSVLYGAADPGPADGVDGEFWINTVSNFLFGPKAAGTWPAGTSLVGPTGAAGADGAPGADGADGAPAPTAVTSAWSPDITPTGLDAGYERGDGTGSLAFWDPASSRTVTETAFGLETYGGVGIYWAVPATQWSVTTYAGARATNTAYRTPGIFVAEDIVTNPTTANLMKFILEIDGGGEPSIRVQQWSSYTTYSLNEWSLTAGIGYRSGIYMRLTCNGYTSNAAWYLLVSDDAITWHEIATGTLATLTVGPLYHGVLTSGGVSGQPAIYPWIRRRSGASEYRAVHTEGGLIEGPTGATGATGAAGAVQPRSAVLDSIQTIIATSANGHVGRDPLRPSVLRAAPYAAFRTQVDSEATPPTTWTEQNAANVATASVAGGTLTIEASTAGSYDHTAGGDTTGGFYRDYGPRRDRFLGARMRCRAADQNYEIAGMYVSISTALGTCIGAQIGYNTGQFLAFRNGSSDIGSRVSVAADAWYWVAFLIEGTDVTCMYSSSSTRPTKWSDWTIHSTTSTLAGAHTSTVRFSLAVFRAGAPAGAFYGEFQEVFDDEIGFSMLPTVLQTPDVPLKSEGYPATSDVIKLAASMDLIAAGLPDITAVRLQLADAINRLPGDAATWTWSLTGSASANPAAATTFQSAATLNLKDAGTDTTTTTPYRYWSLQAKYASTSSLQPGSLDLARIPVILVGA